MKSKIILLSLLCYVSVFKTSTSYAGITCRSLLNMSGVATDYIHMTPVDPGTGLGIKYSYNGISFYTLSTKQLGQQVSKNSDIKLGWISRFLTYLDERSLSVGVIGSFGDYVLLQINSSYAAGVLTSSGRVNKFIAVDKKYGKIISLNELLLLNELSLDKFPQISKVIISPDGKSLIAIKIQLSSGTQTTHLDHRYLVSATVLDSQLKKVSEEKFEGRTDLTNILYSVYPHMMQENGVDWFIKNSGHDGKLLTIAAVGLNNQIRTFGFFNMETQQIVIAKTAGSGGPDLYEHQARSDGYKEVQKERNIYKWSDYIGMPRRNMLLRSTESTSHRSSGLRDDWN